VIIFNCVNRWD